MGKPKYIYFNDEVAEKLEKVKNMSGLINDLLMKHFQKLDPKNMSPEELDNYIQKKKLEEEYKRKLEELKNGT